MISTSDAPSFDVTVPQESAAGGVANELQTLRRDTGLIESIGAAHVRLEAGGWRLVKAWLIKAGDKWGMRYLVTARLRDGKSAALRKAIDNETLGRGSVAGDEYLRNMGDAREYDDGRVQ